VDPFGALVLPGLGGAPGVTELSAGACDPLDQLDSLPVRDIDGWQDFKTGS